jgi:hypothetical protein
MLINISQFVVNVVTDHRGYEGGRQILCKGPKYVMFTVQMTFHL